MTFSQANDAHCFNGNLNFAILNILRAYIPNYNERKNQ